LIGRGNELTDGQAAFRLRLEQAPEQDRFRLLFEHVRDLVGGLLGVKPATAIDLDRGFIDLGLDSLATLMLWNRLQTDLALALPATLAFKFSSVQSLVDHLAETLGVVSPPAADPRTRAGDSGKKAGLDRLSMPELAGRLAATLAAIRRSHGDA
jgi:acyl carrier protein